MREKNDWRDIASAPKDGTWLWLHLKTGDQAMGRWDGGWFTRHGIRHLTPTHWMPLPEPPEASARPRTGPAAVSSGVHAETYQALATAHADLLAAHASLLQEMEKAFIAILTVVRGDESSQCWTIRRYLDERDVFNDDIQGESRLIEEACKYVLALLRRSAHAESTETETPQ